MSTDRINYGGPAFPTLEEHGFNSGEPGMSLRDYFAAKAMVGLMGRSWDSTNLTGTQIVAQWAKASYAVADAMLKERDKTLGQS